MNKFLTCIVAVATVMSTALTSCGGDDDDNEVIGGIEIPEEGWSGDSENGTLVFTPEAPEYDDDAAVYFSFDMRGGKAASARANIAMPDAKTAAELAKILQDGTWVSYEDDDDDFDDYAYKGAPALARNLYTSVSRAAREFRRPGSRAFDYVLPIPVSRNGNVIYVTIDNLRGLSAGELRTVMDVWCGFASTIPDRVIFGKYENGVYTCNNLYCLNINYRVETTYNAQGYCSRFVTTLELPSQEWAQFFYDVYEEQLWDFEQQFGQRPDLKLDGKKVILDAVILGDVTHAEVDAMICTLDWFNNRPFVLNLF